jgi:diamine N-acetyltransferase
MDVELREITAETVRAICSLDVAGEQRDFVAPNAVSIAEAHFVAKQWMRAIYVGEGPAGCPLIGELCSEASEKLGQLLAICR